MILWWALSLIQSLFTLQLKNKSLILFCCVTTDWGSCFIHPPVLFPRTSVHSHLLYFRLQTFTVCLYMYSKDIFCLCVASLPMFIPTPRFVLILEQNLLLKIPTRLWWNTSFFFPLLVSCCFVFSLSPLILSFNVRFLKRSRSNKMQRREHEYESDGMR